MITIHPFKAWRPTPENVNEVACVPYDVIDTGEAKKLSEGKDKSFLHVIRPEIDLPEKVGLYDDEVYEKGKENLQNYIQEKVLVQENEPGLYLYRQQQGDHVQTGLFSCVSVKDYDEERILKHELTRPDKEEDRTRHIRTQQAHAEPVMLTYKPDSKIKELTNTITQKEAPLYSFTAVDGVEHTVWRVSEPEAFVKAFQAVDALYVSDGHHRCKSASNVAKQLRDQSSTGQEEFEFFPAVIYPMDELQILAYNRVVLKTDTDALMNKLNDNFQRKEFDNPVPSAKGEIGVYINGKWNGFTLPKPENADSVKSLDASRLQDYVFNELLGIKEPRTDKNLAFVGGHDTISKMEKMVDGGKAAVAFSMYPTAIEELVEVSDAGKLMPPKSTWFEPKLRSGLLVHTF
ncbi:MAG: DUF1015 domain-containing protein [Balneolales bacterium]